MTQKALSTSLELRVDERDQAGAVVAHYIASGDNGRVDVIIPKDSRSFTKSLLSAFLPAGYPQSVTEDYLEYQIYDSLQAFSSSIAGLLASRAVLEGHISPNFPKQLPTHLPLSGLLDIDGLPGVGVGDANASPTAAILLSVLQDSLGRIATILFAHRVGTALEPECKMYRLAADFFNDAAMILDCVSPAFPKSSRVLLLSSSSALRALCGVAGNSSKASLSAHFATRGNLAELNACAMKSLSLSDDNQKDSSQETIISLLGMLAGSLVVSRVTSRITTWFTLLFLISIHLWTNYKAVRAVQMRTLNRQRANLVFSSYLQSLANGEPYRKTREFRRKTSERVQRYNMKYGLPSPKQVSMQERIFERDGIIRWHGMAIMGYCFLGMPLKSILDRIHPDVRHRRTGSYDIVRTEDGKNDNEEGQDQNASFESLLAAFKDEQYILSYSFDKSKFFKSKHPCFLVTLKDGSDTLTQAKSWFHAFLCARKLYTAPEQISQPVLAMIEETLEEVRDYWPQIHSSLEEADWDLDVGALETRSGVRVRIESESKRR